MTLPFNIITVFITLSDNCLVATTCRFVTNVATHPTPRMRGGGNKRELSYKIRATYNRWPIYDLFSTVALRSLRCVN